MPNPVAFFAIHADDVERARVFYGKVFGWSFDSWGPPDFYLITTGTEVDRHLRGALQRRAEPLNGEGMRGFECSIAVESVDAIGRLVEEHGGTVTLPKSAIPGIGWVVKLRDTEGNDVAAVEYQREGR